MSRRRPPVFQSRRQPPAVTRPPSPLARRHRPAIHNRLTRPDRTKRPRFKIAAFSTSNQTTGWPICENSIIDRPSTWLDCLYLRTRADRKQQTHKKNVSHSRFQVLVRVLFTVISEWLFLDSSTCRPSLPPLSSHQFLSLALIWLATKGYLRVLCTLFVTFSLRDDRIGFLNVPHCRVGFFHFLPRIDVDVTPVISSVGLSSIVRFLCWTNDEDKPMAVAVTLPTIWRPTKCQLPNHVFPSFKKNIYPIDKPFLCLHVVVQTVLFRCTSQPQHRRQIVCFERRLSVPTSIVQTKMCGYTTNDYLSRL